MELTPAMETAIGQSILDARMVANDAEAVTIKDYLLKLLRLVWVEEEGFDGKRPFGNSGWQREVHETLVERGFIKGKMEDGYLTWYDEKAADLMISLAIKAL